MQIPMVISIWDDEYAIGFQEEQTTKQSISEVLMGFQRTDSEQGNNESKRMGLSCVYQSI